LLLGYISAVENDRIIDPNDSTDRENYLAHVNVKGILGGQFSGILDYDSNSAAAGTGNTNDNDIWTIGARQAGKVAGFDYRGEYYYQWGSGNGQKDANQTTDADRAAYMFGVRVGKSFNNVSFKPGITVWYDYLSGTNDEDQRDGSWNSFNTLFDTGHKFYGLQDVFLGVGSGGNTGTQGLGLQDLALKTKFNPMPGWTLKVDYHWFWTAESIAANTTTSGVPNVVIAGGEAPSNNLGNEIDITAVTKMNANTKVMIGYSHYDATQGFFALKNTGVGANGITSTPLFAGTDDADWAYVQFDVKF
jgi:hypothetical protein